jgi:hypothetical protein
LQWIIIISTSIKIRPLKNTLYMVAKIILQATSLQRKEVTYAVYCNCKEKNSYYWVICESCQYIKGAVCSWSMQELWRHVCIESSLIMLSKTSCVVLFKAQPMLDKVAKWACVSFQQWLENVWHLVIKLKYVSQYTCRLIGIFIKSPKVQDSQKDSLLTLQTTIRKIWNHILHKEQFCAWWMICEIC